MHIPSLEPPVSPESEIKTCPCCGATLFADMDICYGCLYDFSSEKVPQNQLCSAEVSEGVLEGILEGISKGVVEDALVEEVPVDVYDSVSFEHKDDRELQVSELEVSGAQTLEPPPPSPQSSYLQEPEPQVCNPRTSVQAPKLTIQTKAGSLMLRCTPQGIALLGLRPSIAQEADIQLSRGTKVSWGGVSFLIS